MVDTSQLLLGTFADSYATAQAKYGRYTGHFIDLIVDGFVATKPIAAQFDNVRVNSKLYTFERANGDGGDDEGDGGHHGDNDGGHLGD